MNYESMLSLIKQEKIYPVYLLYGKENYLKEDILKKLRKRLINPAYRELNYKVFYGEKISINVVINDLKILPLISEHKLVVIKEAENINKNDEKKLVNYFNQLNSKNIFSTLIIIYKEGMPNKELITAIKRIGIILSSFFHIAFLLRLIHARSVSRVIEERVKIIFTVLKSRPKGIDIRVDK